MMKQNILTLLVLVALLMPAALRAAGPSASSILAQMRKSMLAKPAVEAQFTINGADGAVQGSALMAGAAFAFTTPQLDVWFDGRTQWVFLHSTGEVSITEPTADELATTNPFVVLSAYDTHYTSRRLPDSSGRRRVRARSTRRRQRHSIHHCHCRYPRKLAAGNNCRPRQRRAYPHGNRPHRRPRQACRHCLPLRRSSSSRFRNH